MSGTWCTIESDPGVFTELIESIGVHGVQVEELYSLDESSFAHLRPVYGLVFLFKWTGDDNRLTSETGGEPGLFFAHQVIPNACATQAILSVLLNCADKIDLGKTLLDFISFTRDFPPEMKGLAISNSETIRSVHNGFCRQDPFFADGKDGGGKKEDAFHFVAYVPYNGKVYELDGLKPGPITLGDIPVNLDDADSDNWLSVASPAIEKRIARYSAGEIRFNLMAIVKNCKTMLRRQASPISKLRPVLQPTLSEWPTLESSVFSSHIGRANGGTLASFSSCGYLHNGERLLLQLLLLCAGLIYKRYLPSAPLCWADVKRQVAIEARERCMTRVKALDEELSRGGGVQQLEGTAALSAREQETCALEKQRAAELRAAGECDLSISFEEAKFAQWRKENIRRKHDYVPFAVKLLDILAQQTDFDNLIESMRTKAKRRENAKNAANNGKEGF